MSVCVKAGGFVISDSFPFRPAASKRHRAYHEGGVDLLNSQLSLLPKPSVVELQQAMRDRRRACGTTNELSHARRKPKNVSDGFCAKFLDKPCAVNVFALVKKQAHAVHDVAAKSVILAAPAIAKNPQRVDDVLGATTTVRPLHAAYALDPRPDATLAAIKSDLEPKRVNSVLYRHGFFVALCKESLEQSHCVDVRPVLVHLAKDGGFVLGSA
jgi:hypothetical protein